MTFVCLKVDIKNIVDEKTQKKLQEYCREEVESSSDMQKKTKKQRKSDDIMIKWTRSREEREFQSEKEMKETRIEAKKKKKNTRDKINTVHVLTRQVATRQNLFVIMFL